MNDRERARLDALLAQLTSNRHAQDFLRDHYEGIYASTAALARLRTPDRDPEAPALKG